MFLLGSISQPHSSFFNTLALIGPHPHQLSLTTSSQESSEEIQMYLVQHRPVVARWLVYLNCICGQLSRVLTPSWSEDSFFFSPVDARLYLYPQWCGGLVIMRPISLHGDYRLQYPRARSSMAEISVTQSGKGIKHFSSSGSKPLKVLPYFTTGLILFERSLQMHQNCRYI